MSYNQEHFGPELNKQLSDKLNSLEVWQNHVLEFLIQYLLASNKQEQLQHCNAFLQLLAKIRFNLESANILMPMMHDDYRFKTSINLIYRAIIDDVINAYYLWGTVALADPNQEALHNELRIMHKEFLMSSTKLVNADREFEKLVDSLKEIKSIPDRNVDAEFQAANPDLVDANGKWKKNSDIRATTSAFFIPLFNQPGNTSFISETQKLEFIKNRGIETSHNLMAIFKYLSQYQHFSPKAHDLLLSHIEFDIEIYQRCLGELLLLFNQLLAFIKLKDIDELKKYWEELAPLVFDSFSA